MRQEDIEIINDIIVKAGDIAMHYYKKEYHIETKSDLSPVTTADIEINNYIVNALKAIFPNIPVASEEGSPEENNQAIINNKFWLIDPIDGTKSFINHEDEFTVNIGLVENGFPIAGFIYWPTNEDLYYTGENKAAFKQLRLAYNLRKQIHSKPPSKEGLRVLLSTTKSKKLNDYVDNLTEKVKTTRAVASSLKLCFIAEGEADFYPRIGDTMEWDTAAGHAILNAAGGSIETIDGQPLMYGKSNIKNPHFIARGKYLSF